MTITPVLLERYAPKNLEPHVHESEKPFYAFLAAQGWMGQIEPWIYPLGIDPLTRRMWEVKPDFLVTGIPGRVLDPDNPALFLELTIADRFTSPRSLPPEVRRRNKLHSRSRRRWISPAKYLAHKRAKIAAAEALYPVVIILLTAQRQAEIMACPELLEAEIDRRLAEWHSSQLQLVS